MEPLRARWLWCHTWLSTLPDLFLLMPFVQCPGSQKPLYHSDRQCGYGAVRVVRVVSWKAENCKWYGPHYSLKTRYLWTLLNTAFCCFPMVTKGDSHTKGIHSHACRASKKQRWEPTKKTRKHVRKTDRIKQRQADLVQ